jgi:hypothetical protein
MPGGAGTGTGGGVSSGGAAPVPDAGSSGGRETGHAGDASVGPAPEAAQCPAGRGDCDGRADNGCEINLMEHPNHCGTCARDCLGADCHHGLCDAIQLSTESVGDIAVAGGDVYWVAGNSIRASSRDGGNLRNVASPEGNVNFIAVGGSDLYWTDIGNWVFPNNFSGNSGLVRVAPLLDRDGGGPRTLYTGFIQQPLFELAGAIATDDKNVYFEIDERSGTGSAFFKMPLGGGTAQRLFPDTGYLLTTDVQFMRAAKGYLFGAGGFVEALQGIAAGGWLFRIGVDDGSYQKIWKSDRMAAITLDDYGDYVYVTAVESTGSDAGAPDASLSSQLRLFRVPMKGGPPEFLWNGGGLGIAVDDTGIYASTDSSLQRFDLSGGAPTVIVTGQSPRIVVTDDQAVYWSNFDAPGGLWKVAK